MSRILCSAPVAWSLVCLAGAVAGAAEPKPSPAALDFFEKRVRPLLAARCYSCHGPDSKARGGLRVDSLAGLLRGGDHGPALVPGKPEDSLLVSAVNHGDVVKMPKNKLPPQEIADLTAWVKMGAPWPDAVARAGPAEAAGKPLFTAAQRNFWAFRAPVRPPVPAVRDRSWPRSPLDAFILAKLEEQGLRPAPLADKRTLIRRATFDLLGLPPSPEEVNAFLADDSPEAFARVVDRLLASPQYGERWGRHWLDVARYADSNGMDENLAQANAYRYRDYVVNAFNRDVGYDQFIREQLAGDLLSPLAPGGRGAGGEGEPRLIATGFLALGPKMLAEDDPVKMEMDIIDEQVDMVGRVFLGLTLGCARCHDHKFDPIPTADYYALAGIFKSTKTMENFRVVARWYERPLASKEETEAHAAHRKKIDEKKAEIARLTKEKDQKPDELKRLRDDLAALEKSLPPLPEAMGVTEGTVTNLRIHLRGNHLTLGQEVPRQFPRILAGERQTPIAGKQSGRLQLAEWLTRPDHPLTARVLVNRVWHWHFGAGLVRSTDNFGTLGDRPVNQPLLDWLAVRFVEGGWSLKRLHREIMLSCTYQMSSTYDDKAAVADPENRLHWHWRRRRLEAEALRDAILAVSGSLDLKMGGSLFQGANRAYVPGYPNSTYDRYDFNRRSIYLPVIRSDLYSVFQAFDFADPSTSNGERAVTTVAPQALFLMNGKLVAEQTKHLAKALLARHDLDDAGRVRLVYERAFARPATERETERALAFLQRAEATLRSEKVAEDEGRLRAWQSLCRVLLATSEFLYVE
jgi:mono/diheme cytochrome c family protein